MVNRRDDYPSERDLGGKYQNYTLDDLLEEEEGNDVEGYGNSSYTGEDSYEGVDGSYGNDTYGEVDDRGGVYRYRGKREVDLGYDNIPTREEYLSRDNSISNKSNNSNNNRNNNSNKGGYLKWILVSLLLIGLVAFGVIKVFYGGSGEGSGDRITSSKLGDVTSLYYNYREGGNNWIRDDLTEEDINRVEADLEGSGDTKKLNMLRDIKAQFSDLTEAKDLLARVYTNDRIDYDANVSYIVEDFPSNYRPELYDQLSRKYREASVEIKEAIELEDRVKRFKLGTESYTSRDLEQLKYDVNHWLGTSIRKERVLSMLNELIIKEDEASTESEVYTTNPAPVPSPEPTPEPAPETTSDESYRELIDQIKDEIKEKVNKETGYEF